MKYALIFFLILAGGLTYVRTEQPTVWDSMIKRFMAPQGDVAKTSPADVPPPVQPSAPTPPPAPEPPAPPIPTAVAPPPTPELITPSDDMHLNPDHVHPVEQPVQPTESYAQAYVPPNPLPQQNNWTWTVNGRDYLNVVVTGVEQDVVHISYDGGATSFHLGDTPADIRQVFNYDPVHAAAVAKAKADAAAIAAEQAAAGNK